MLKKNIKKDISMRLSFKLLYISLICILIYSCDKNEKLDVKESLVINKNESIILDQRFNLDSIGFKYSSDSIIFYIRHLELPFLKYKGNVYEIREAYRDMIDYERTDSILTFSTIDTTFIYESAIDRNFIGNIFYYGLADCKYEIKKIGNNSYQTIKQSLVDTTFKEIYYYDKKYRVTKFINTYKDNVCVYISLKQ